MACQKNEQVRNYLGTKLNVKSNWKLRAVKDMLLNHPCIKQANDRPILLLWFEDRSASSDRIRNDNYNETGSISQVTMHQYLSYLSAAIKLFSVHIYTI